MYPVKRHANYTYAFNIFSGRHGWIRLTPAYSVRLVEELLAGHTTARRILDPFGGTGTTALCAAYNQRECVTVDINPFLAWLTQAKSAYYSSEDIAFAKHASALARDLALNHAIAPSSPPPITNIHRWWRGDVLDVLCAIHSAIMAVTQDNAKARDLLLIAFCRTLIALSNVAFNHHSMSFKDAPPTIDQTEWPNIFMDHVKYVLAGAEHNPARTARVLLGDSRYLADDLGDFDLIITSPPYANRISYIRELRPYMYWLGFLKAPRAAGELDWNSIGGTWGIATSRLLKWERAAPQFRAETLSYVLESLATNRRRSALLLCKYVDKYFDDIWHHLSNLTRHLAPGANIHYIVGNSKFYDTLVPTEKIYAEMLGRLGFINIECRPIRKRNSKRELLEFDIAATWP